MATLRNFFRANTDTISTLIQASGTTAAVTPLFTKTVRVSKAAPATPVTTVTSNIISGDGLDVLLGATGVAYISIQVVARGSALTAAEGATVTVKNFSTFADAINNTVSHTLTNVGDNVLIPWRIVTGDDDIDKCPTVDATLNVAAGAGKTVDLAVSVFFA